MDKEIRPYEGRLKRIVLAYMPVAMGGAVATFVYDVGAHPGSSARDDIVFRGSPLVPPLFMPIALLGASYPAAKRGPVGLVATAVIGLVGLGFIGGTTFNLPNDLHAARAAGSPVWPTPNAMTTKKPATGHTNVSLVRSDNAESIPASLKVACCRSVVVVESNIGAPSLPKQCRKSCL